MRRVSDMLRTLWKNVKKVAHKNVQFSLVSLLLGAAIFATPISLITANGRAGDMNNSSLFSTETIKYENHAGLSLNIAHAQTGNAVGDWLFQQEVDSIVNPDDCGITNITACVVDAFEWIFMRICWLIFKITGFIFVGAGKIFDLSMIFSFSGTLFKSFTFIESTWLLIRNLINSMFIFVILYVALKQLLSIGSFDSKSVQKALIGIITAALLINFSLFFTKVVIDISNVTSRTLYYSMRSTPADQGTTSYGPANALAFGLNTIGLLEDPAASSDENSKDTSNLKLGLVYLGGSAVNLVGAFSFFMMSFYFLVRIAILIILMITSPVYFMAHIVNHKKVNELKSKWVSTLTGQLSFPVVYLLLILIVVNIVNSGLLTGRNINGSFQEGIQGGSNGFAIIINFTIVIVLMLFAFKYAKETAGAAASWGGKLAGLSGAMMFAGGALAGRQVLGRLGGAVGKSGAVKSWATSDSKFKRMVGDTVIKKSTKMHEGSWDVRNTASFAGGAGMMGVAAKDFGKGTAKTAKSQYTPEGRAKIAAAKVTSYSNIEAQVKEANRRIGPDKINEKEFKEFKENLIKDIKDKNKGKPEEQERLIKMLVGEKTYRTSKDFKETRSAVNKEKATKEVKDTVKKVGEVTKEIKTLDEEIKKETASGNTAKVKELEDKKKIKVTERDGEKDSNGKVTKPGLVHKFEEASKKAPAGLVTELAAEDIGVLQQQLSKAHVAAITKSMAESEYSDEDMEKMTKMFGELRKNPNANPEVLKYLNDGASRGTLPFDLGFQEDLLKSMQNLPQNLSDILAQNLTHTLPQIQQDSIKEMMNVARNITSTELENMDLNVVLDLNILQHLNPAEVSKYAKGIFDGNDTNAQAQLTQHSQLIEIGQMLPHVEQRKRTAFSRALLGQGGGGKKRK